MYNGKKLDDLEKEILERVNIIIKKKKLTNVKLAERLHYSAPSISKILSGKVTLTISFLNDFIDNICDGDMHYLLTGYVFISENYLNQMFGNADCETQKKLIETYAELGKNIHNLISK